MMTAGCTKDRAPAPEWIVALASRMYALEGKPDSPSQQDSKSIRIQNRSVM